MALVNSCPQHAEQLNLPHIMPHILWIKVISHQKLQERILLALIMHNSIQQLFKYLEETFFLN
jgi:hypothetical protein